MRANEFALVESAASRRKQAIMNARARTANTQVPATAVQPPVSSGTSTPAVAPTQSAPQSTDWAGLNQAMAPNQPQAGSSYLDKIKQKMYSAGKGVANRFTTQGKVASRTEQLFMDKFLKDMSTAERTTTGLRGDKFDPKTWVSDYLTKNNWDAGDQQEILDNAIAANNKKAIAKAMAAIGKYNNLGSTMRAKAAGDQAAVSGNKAMGQMATQLGKPMAGSQGGAGAMGQMASQLTKPAATPQSTTQPAANPFGQMASQLTKAPASTTSTTEPISFGGKKLDPTDPADARMIAMLTQQGKI